MKLTWNMPAPLYPHYLKELDAYYTCWEQGLPLTAWKHLERAHILGQAYPLEHTAVHWKMLTFGLRTKNVREIIGQLPRILVGGVKS